MSSRPDQFFEYVLEPISKSYRVQIVDFRKELERANVKINPSVCRVYRIAPAKYRAAYLIIRLIEVKQILKDRSSWKMAEYRMSQIARSMRNAWDWKQDNWIQMICISELPPKPPYGAGGPIVADKIYEIQKDPLEIIKELVELDIKDIMGWARGFRTISK